MGIEGYQMPKSGSPRKISSSVIPKNKSPGPIEAEAKYRKQFPGAGAYVHPFERPWNEQMPQRNIKGDMAKGARKTMADVIQENALKPEKSTPSPNDYNVQKEKFLPSLGRGGASLLQA